MKRILPYLRLMRISALPTCWANVLTAFWLCGGADHYGLLGLLLFASSCFYLGGMVLNDVCDAKIDAVERPERPIPSGQILLESAITLTTWLCLAGMLGVIFCDWGGAGPFMRSAEHFLILCIICYNYYRFKQIPIIGPITMGLCRFFNILMVSFAVGGGMSVYAVSVFAYITAVTILSGYEAQSFFVRKLVGVGLSSLILIDAVWCFAFVGVVPALYVFALYPLAMGLRKIVSMT